MRYVIQFLVPALVLIVVTLVFLRNRGGTPGAATAATAESGSSPIGTGTFIAILVVAAVFTVVLVYELQGFHD